MRAFEFLKETASSGATTAGNVASVVKPLQQNNKNQSFFGTNLDDYPPYGSTVAIIRRPGLVDEIKKQKKTKNKKLAVN